MLSTVLHFLHGIALGDIPWWFYVAASFAAATAIVIYVPGRLGLGLALLVALALGDVGFQAKGYQQGYAEATTRVNAEWAKRAQAEKDRIASDLKAVLQAETARADAAEAKNKELQGRVHDAEQSVPADANGNPTVISGDIAGKLYAIKGPKGAPGRRDRASHGAFGPFPLPRVLRLHR